MALPRPVLDDMPIIIKHKIVQKLGPATLYGVRYCSKTFQEVVETTTISDWRVYHRRDRYSNSVRCKGNDEELELRYTPRGENGCVVEIIRKFYNHGRHGEEMTKYVKTIFENGKTCQERAMTTFSKLFQKSKLSLKQLELSSHVRGEDRLLEEIGRVLENRRHQVSVDCLQIIVPRAKQADVMCVLPFFEPRRLEDLWLRICSDEPFDQIIQTRQYKEAERFICQNTCNIGFEDLKHFNRLDMELPTLSLDDCKKFMHLASHGRASVCYSFSFPSSERRAIKRFLEPFKCTNVPGYWRLPEEPEYIVSFQDTPNELKVTYECSIYDDDGFDEITIEQY